MGISSRGAPIQRIYRDGTRYTRAYLGGQLIWSDTAMGQIGARAAKLTLAMPVPRVTPGFGAPAAGFAVQAHAPVVRSHATVQAPRASVQFAARTPDTPRVAPAPVATMVWEMLPPSFVDAEVVSAPAMIVAVMMPPPIVGIAVAPPAIEIDSEALLPTVSASSAIEVPLIAVAVEMAVPAHQIATYAPAAELTTAALVPEVFAASEITVPAATAGATVHVPVVGIAVTPPVVAVTAEAQVPAVTAASSSTPPAVAVAAQAHTPVMHADAGVAAPVMTVSVQAHTPVVSAIQFEPSGMTKNGTQLLGTSYAQIPNWVADTANYPGSTVVAHALVSNGGKSNATVAASIPVNNSQFASVNGRLRLMRNGSLLFEGANIAIPAVGSGTLTVTATGVTVADDDAITVEGMAAMASSLTVQTGASTWVRIT